MKRSKNDASASKKKGSGTTTPSPTTPEQPAKQRVEPTWYPFLQVRIGLVVGLVSFLAYYGLQSDDPQPLPSVYAVCSPDGQESVYTVNALNEKAECLLVNGSHIALVGSKGKWQDRIYVDFPLTFHSRLYQRRPWGEFTHTLFTRRSHSGPRDKRYAAFLPMPDDCSALFVKIPTVIHWNMVAARKFLSQT